MEEYKLNDFHDGLEKLGIPISERQEEQFVLYYRMLIEWNQKMNLTAITDWDDVVKKHFLDSLCLVQVVPDIRDRRVADVGTGAGFPGIPLKIAFPDLNMVLIDSVSKKLRFLDAVIEELGLSGAMTVHGRAEDLAHDKEYRQQFDIAVSRAVSFLPVLTEYCLPFVKIGGSFVAYKSENIDSECESAKQALFMLGGRIEEIRKYSLPDNKNRRSLVCIKKVEGTPRAYPRKAGTPARNPL